jgi:phosphoribosylformylglycinamidine cyclo-ligase
MNIEKKNRYAEAGVDVETANRFISKLAPLVSSTFKRGVLTSIGGFSGLFSLDTSQYTAPVLVASTDGVGTKLKLAFMMDRHDTIGIDLVAMCVNDIIVCGAQPLFMLDYFATGKLKEGVSLSVLQGIVAGCKEAGCALIGGETAEMPGFYANDEYDLAGFVVGVVDRNRIIDGSEISEGDALIGLASSGLHSNGYSLVRKVFLEEKKYNLSDRLDALDGAVLGDVLLTPTRIYVNTVLHLLKNNPIKGMVHITGGGFQDNIPRVIPKSCKAVIDLSAWRMPPVFELLSADGGIPTEEMLNTFNCGIGMILIVPKGNVQDVLLQTAALGEQAVMIGRVESRQEDEAFVVFNG